MECYTYLRNVTDLLSDGKTPYERRFGQPFTGPIIPFGSLVEYHLKTAKDQSRIHQFGPKVLPGKFFGYVLYAVGILKGDVLVADLEELEKMDASEIHAKRLNAKEVLTHTNGEKYIPDHRWNSQIIRKISGSENTHLFAGSRRPRRRTRTSSRIIRRVFTTTSRLIAG